MRPHTFSFQSNPTIDRLIKSDFSFKPLENYLKKLNRSYPVRIRMIDELIETLQQYLTGNKNNSPLLPAPVHQVQPIFPVGMRLNMCYDYGWIQLTENQVRIYMVPPLMVLGVSKATKLQK